MRLLNAKRRDIVGVLGGPKKSLTGLWAAAVIYFLTLKATAGENSTSYKYANYTEHDGRVKVESQITVRIGVERIDGHAQDFGGPLLAVVLLVIEGRPHEPLEIRGWPPLWIGAVRGTPKIWMDIPFVVIHDAPCEEEGD